LDSVTQLTFGAAVGGALGGRHAGWRAFAWGAAFGTLPDLDTFFPFENPVAAFTYHRGYSHALLVHTVLAPLLAWLPYRLHRQGDVGYRRWWLLVWLVLLTHALLDATTVYGTQIGLPITDYPVGLGSIFIIDPLYTLPLLVGVLGALCCGTWRRGWRWNTLGLVLSCAYLGWAIATQAYVSGVADRALARAELPADRVLVTPTPLNTVLWRIVAVGDNAYWEGFYRLGEAGIDFQRYPRGADWLAQLESRWAVGRLQAFTKGFYAGRRRGDSLLMQDLRMGREPGYAFSFAVGAWRNGVLTGLPATRAATPRLATLAFLRERLFGVAE